MEKAVISYYGRRLNFQQLQSFKIHCPLTNIPYFTDVLITQLSHTIFFT